MFKLKLPKGAFELGAKVVQIKESRQSGYSNSGYQKEGEVTANLYQMAFIVDSTGNITINNLTLHHSYWNFGDGERVLFEEYMALAGSHELEVEIE